jgi:hypothetical protein
MHFAMSREWENNSCGGFAPMPRGLSSLRVRICVALLQFWLINQKPEHLGVLLEHPTNPSNDQVHHGATPGDG